MRVDITGCQSPLGRVLLAEREANLLALVFEEQLGWLQPRLERAGFCCELKPDTAAPAWLAAYFQGQLGALQGPALNLIGSDFQRSVWAGLLRVPAGSWVSYSRLAEDVGMGHAVRAVAHAVALNPVLLAVPCHRVLRADGSLGGYSGGSPRKRWLLEHEGALAPKPLS